MELSTINETDLYLYHQGTNYYTYRLLGAHCVQQDGVNGVRFAVWAPHAKAVSVVGDFNNWDTRLNPLQRLEDGEVWTAFLPGIVPGAVYKYAIEPSWGGPHIMKADPYGFYAEKKPQTASRVYDMANYTWSDEDWQAQKHASPSYGRPLLIYEVHLGSWKRAPDGGYLNYRDAARQLVAYVKEMNYTHIEFMPLCEHPFDGSWGYQATGYYAVTSRYGEPNDFKYLVDHAHQNGIGIIMDWVPGHFCKDDQGLRHFDGQNLYESDNISRAENGEWGTTNFDYGRTEVQSFLISNALFWLTEYHIDGLRIDAVANMLYLSYGRDGGYWERNKYGGSGNLEAMDFLKKLNAAIFKYQPEALMIAEESTSWPMISKPVYMGGLGFNYKWNMGWMNDVLKYMSLDPFYRKYHQDKLTFSLMYAFSENFVLPLSHDEVVHGKCSLIGKMPGDYWQKFAGLRAFYGYWMAHPGKKLLFMGSEFAQFIEWKYDDSLDWHLIEQYPMHQKMQAYSKALNAFYVANRPLWEIDFEWAGFSWIDCSDTEHSVLSFSRMADDSDDFVIAICNFTPEVRSGYRVGMPKSGVYHEVFNSDWEAFGGSDVRNDGELLTEDIAWQDRPQSLTLTLPPLATIYLRWQGGLPEVLLAEKKLPVRKRRQTSGTEESALAEPAAKKPRRKPAEKKTDTKTTSPVRGRKKAGELAVSVVDKPDNSREQALTEKKSSRKKATAAEGKKTAEQEQVKSLTAKVPRTKAQKPASAKKAVKPAAEDKKKASK